MPVRPRNRGTARRKRRSAGAQLRTIREQLDLTLRDVEWESRRIARELRNNSFAIPFSRLHDIESKPFVPNIFRAYTLSRIYRMKLEKILELYGVPAR